MLKIRSFLKQAKYGPPYTMGSLALHALGTGCSGLTSPSITSVLMLVAEIDYFNKWIEVVPHSEVTRQHVVKFVWQNLVYHFGLSYTIISDNGMNFASKEAATFCAKYKIAH